MIDFHILSVNIIDDDAIWVHDVDILVLIINDDAMYFNDYVILLIKIDDNFISVNNNIILVAIILVRIRHLSLSIY